MLHLFYSVLLDSGIRNNKSLGKHDHRLYKYEHRLCYMNDT